ncbi:MAG: hypothetical protein M5U08_16465 [Burkholderiales bacterium]|nr:hypothetical protein [Burkholderiales bacterium]
MADQVDGRATSSPPASARDATPGEPVRFEHEYDLSAFAHLASDGESGDNLQYFATRMHEAAATQDEVQGVLRWYQDAARGREVTWGGLSAALGREPEKIASALSSYVRMVPDADFPSAVEVAEAKQYVARLAEHHPEVVEALEVMLPDGPVGDDPKAIRLFARWARASQGATPHAGERGRMSIEGELAELRKLMCERGSRYWKGPDAERLQARYRQLLVVSGGH